MGRGTAEIMVHGKYRTLDMTQFHFDRIPAGRKIIEKAIIGCNWQRILSSELWPLATNRLVFGSAYAAILWLRSPRPQDIALVASSGTIRKFFAPFANFGVRFNGAIME